MALDSNDEKRIDIMDKRRRLLNFRQEEITADALEWFHENNAFQYGRDTVTCTLKPDPNDETVIQYVWHFHLKPSSDIEMDIAVVSDKLEIVVNMQRIEFKLYKSKPVEELAEIYL